MIEKRWREREEVHVGAKILRINGVEGRRERKKKKREKKKGKEEKRRKKREREREKRKKERNADGALFRASQLLSLSPPPTTNFRGKENPLPPRSDLLLPTIHRFLPY